jgi:hypothetical protein
MKTVAPQRAQPAPWPVSSQSIKPISSRSSPIHIAQSVSQALPAIEDEDEQGIDIEEVVHEDPMEPMNAVPEVEMLIDDEFQLYDDRAEYIWPDASPTRAERYRRQVQATRDVFEDEPDMYDTAMVYEYAEDIFQCMSELEVSLLADLLSLHPLR